MATYLLTQKADSDIASLYEHGILSFGLDQAQRYLMGLYSRFQTLADNKTIGRLATELAPNLRRMEYGAHVIFYQPEPEHVLIIRVLRKEMDFQRHLRGG